MEQFRVVIAQPLPDGSRTSVAQIDPEITQLSWTTGVGGFVGLNLGVSIPGRAQTALPETSAVEVPDLADVRVYAGSEDGFYCWRGRCQDVDDNLGQKVRALTAAGYGTSQGALGDQWFWVSPKPEKTAGSTTRAANDSGGEEPTGPDDRPVSAGALLRRLVYQTAAHLLRIGDREQFVDPGGSFTAREQSGRFLGQSIDQFMKTGGSDGADFSFAVWQDLRVEVRPMEPPTDSSGRLTPDYRITPDDRVQWKRSMGKMVGACEVQYTPRGGKEQSTGVQVVTGWATAHGGLMRSELIPGGTMSKAEALSVRARYLRRYQTAVEVGTLTVPFDRPLAGPSGEPVPAYQYRYGQWAEYGGRPYFVNSTSVDCSARRTQMVLTWPPGVTG